MFSTSVTTVATSSVLLLDDTPNLVSNAVLIAIMNDRPIVDDIVACYLDGMAVKADGYYNYGRDKYTYGLPSGSLAYNVQEDSDVQLVIEAELGQSIDLLCNVVDICNTDYFAYTHLIENRGWDASTGIVSTPPFTSTNTVTYAGSVILSSGVLQLAYLNGEDGLRYETIATEVLYPTERYYHVAYTTGGSTVTRYWNYRANLGTWESLITRTTTAESAYFPVVPLRRDNVDMTDPSLKSTDLYKTSKTALNKLGINFTDIGDAINENDDIAKVDHAYVVLGAHIYSEVPNTINYLHAFFAKLSGISEYTISDAIFFDTRGGNKSVPKVNSLRITEDNYDIELVYRYITNEVVEGVVADIGSVVRTVDVREDASIHYQVTNHTGSTYTTSVSYDDSRITFSKQLTSTTYQKVTVVAPNVINHIYKNKTVDATLANSTDVDSSSFIIPINVFVARNMGLMEYNYLMYDTIRLVFNSHERTSLKWYQTQLFTFVVTVIALAATVYSIGTAYGSIAMAASLGTMAVVKVVAIMILRAVVYSYVGTLIVDAIGIKAAIIATVLIAVYKATQGDASGVMSVSVAGAPFAIDLLSITQALSIGIKEVTTDAMDSITAEYTEFEEESDLLSEALEDKLEDLDTGLDINPMLVTQHQEFITDTWETPTEFFDRTIHAGNIGVYCLESTSVFVEQLVKLPTTINLY